MVSAGGLGTIQEQVCKACGNASMEAFEIPGISNMLYCPECELYQNGATIARDIYSLSYHSNYARNRKRKMRASFIRLRLLDAMLKEPGRRILDVGCSVGYIVEAATALGWDAEGVDVCEDVVNDCVERGLHCRMLQNDTLPYPDNSFDCVTAWHVIEHVTNVEVVLREWLRVLRPGGLLVLETPNASCKRVRRERAHYHRFWKRGHIYVFSPVSLQMFVTRAGFELLPPPQPTRLRGLSLTQYVGLLGYYTCEYSLKKLLGIDKAFQVYARKPLHGSNDFPLLENLLQ